jgi:ABC-type transport system involved in cytochrome bd biosynthesis fused ATPase/permease subunit
MWAFIPYAFTAFGGVGLGALWQAYIASRKRAEEIEEKNSRQPVNHTNKVLSRLDNPFVPPNDTSFMGDIVIDDKMEKFSSKLNSKLGWLHLFFGPSGCGKSTLAPLSQYQTPISFVSSIPMVCFRKIYCFDEFIEESEACSALITAEV